MAKDRTECTRCNNPILQRTAVKNGGLCALCKRDSERQENTHAMAGSLTQFSDDVLFEQKVEVAGLLVEQAVNWQVFEDELVYLTSEYLKVFANTHQDLEFYGLAFDCNSASGQVHLCANS
ncbi:MAG: hypothetical protein AAF483_10410 [Planctomycetota bacterium]